MKSTHISEKIIAQSFHLAVRFIELLAKDDAYIHKVTELRALKPGTLGKAIADCLDQHGYKLVPGFESHDLKHTLLDYEMTPLGEIRLQAFMLGNGNWSLPSIAIFIYGSLLLPQHWASFLKDYQKGLQATPIKNWKIEDYKHYNLETLRNQVLNPPLTHQLQSNNRSGMHLSTISKLGSFAVIAAGIFGMFYCLPYLFSSCLEDLVGAGFPFIAGAILVIGGLINLSILANKNPSERIV